ncbi:Thermostable carboxypeptidase 1 [Rosistilla carotiformis]|uniref:Metal-dependent carboxypeptidase n=1 Tax=Rosistilla carotiformis TaxID=2528017 RepID=A0A518JRJ5_9BACT|nr:carboxypeptidase M32 [Rosistilla carotiformis]QDV68170.1 Thermostable carboxypeptidase 1 [Rosistilla carotiformis]
MNGNETFDQLAKFTRETALLESISYTLEWDERTYMPTGGRAYRADQVTYLAGMAHRRRTDPQMGDWIAELQQSELAGDRHSDAGATIHRIGRDFERACKLPQDLVEGLSRATVVGQQRWEDARKADDFAAFLPALEEIIRLKIESAERLADGGNLYDALLDEYEEDAKSEQLTEVFRDLRSELVPLVAAIRDSKTQPNTDLLRRNFPVDAQRAFCKQVAEAVGFDFTRGRLDETSHPFCTSLGPSDCRILTRYDAHWFPGALYGTLHEAGHGIYDQGLRGDQFGLPPGTYVSLGIHESQSRMWENMVGRSLPFCQHFYGELQRTFPEALSDVDVNAFHFAVNTVEPSLIRVEADEVTYNLHIIIRFELEQALISGDLKPKDLPEAWNQKYQEYLGITPPNNADGVLQDVHWSAGLLGYFPTYTLGNLIAAQLFDAAGEALGDLDAMFAKGEFSPLRTWLNENIHRHGCVYSPNELVQRATGKPLSSQPLVGYLKQKFGALYNL